jgi:predicted lipase
LILGPLNSALFPGLSSSIQVHQGFANEHAKTAQTILAAVLTLLSQHSASSVVITGHSLGAALALLDSIYLPLHVPAGTRVSAFTYGMPRVGNAAFANYVDATHNGNLTHINNKEDPIATVPGMSLGYVHPSGEVHIQDSGSWVACSGQDNPSNLCIVGDVPTLFESNLSDHDGPYDDGIVMASC